MSTKPLAANVVDTWIGKAPYRVLYHCTTSRTRIGQVVTRKTEYQHECFFILDNGLNQRFMAKYFLNKEVQMNESTDENEQAFVSAGRTSGVQPVWEAEEIADGIDRMIGEGGKDSPQQLSLKDKAIPV
jgi:hypothetical protein